MVSTTATPLHIQFDFSFTLMVLLAMPHLPTTINSVDEHEVQFYGTFTRIQSCTVSSRPRGQCRRLTLAMEYMSNQAVPPFEYQPEP